ncbi:sigma-70 family RNA polymerase sigma factor [Gammaproteobacteria bacterium]|jgi:RNA polymerase sigma-70 factor (ECF subfamily)|nr:sigma-70 family RNA polymerase sigma factor [Gammaproteobacteria bacterium]MDA7821761.1 sigma-70 family RNA polymerase sigma factor [Gammaproteobacteria bacterium]MDA8674902.1 sigma-70 family RNA polymerase sigma factor [Gammaproteobacteria bacterium]MDA8899302.1 sigma-70 family RNA polymerase sigma factor [Gammaproteobacteria bacterium]MDA8998368.1 sigma-70 family RNA polymerase sigma factor [Gammaproteobacteria bacterium]|tara:strand:- start:5018 stop:5593 length:576 start_codon:yes stop_codon:yes gene_type:complete
MKTNVHNEDDLLIIKAQNGDEGAFKFLMTKYYPRVYASLFAFTKSREDSEDLTQLTFIKVWQKINSFRGDSAFFTWVYRIAINLAKNHFASSSSKKDKVNISSDDLEIDIPSYENPEISLMHKQSLQNIQSYVKTLPESLKTAFTLREVDGKSYEEISIITDTPIGTVRSRIFRARESIINYINGGNENHG